MRTLTKSLLCMIMLSLLMPTDVFAQKNRNKRKIKKAKTEMAVKNVNTQPTTTQSTIIEKVDNGTAIQNAILEIDDIYSFNIDKKDLSSSYNSAESIILDCMNRKNSKTKDKIIKYYYDSFYQASDEEELDKAVDCAFKYLMLGGSEDEDVMWRVLIENYAADADIKNTQFLLNKFVGISVSKNDAYQTTISELNQKYDDVLNPKYFEDVVKGTWVSLDGKYVVRIDKVDSNDGIQLLHSPITPWWAVKKKKNWVQGYGIAKWDLYQNIANSQSVYFNGDEKKISSCFCSNIIKEPNTDLAKSLYQNSQEFLAKGLATSHSSKMNIGGQLALDAVSLGGSLALFFLGNSAAVGSKKANAYGIAFSGKNSKVLDATIKYNCVQLKTNGEHKTIADEETKNQFVKWEESDSLILVSNNTPFFMGSSSISKDDPLLKEYNRINKRYSCWNPRYLVPNIAIAAGGIAGFILGYDMQMKNYDESKGEYINKSKWWRGFGITVASVCIAAAAIPIIDKVRRSARDKAFKQLNERNLEKLRNKATLSISPEIDVINSGVGFNAKLTF